MLDVATLAEEVMGYLADIDVETEGARIYSNYQKVISYGIRLSAIRNQIALLEIGGGASAELKKFRTMILDPTIERMDKIASYESRKITAMQLEYNLEGKST